MNKPQSNGIYVISQPSRLIVVVISDQLTVVEMGKIITRRGRVVVGVGRVRFFHVKRHRRERS
jgi:hypothetical protein